MTAARGKCKNYPGMNGAATPRDTGRRHKGDAGPTLFKASRTPKQIFRDLRNFLAGQFVGATRDDTLLHELLKCLFCKLYLETADLRPRAWEWPDTPAAVEVCRELFGRVRTDYSEIFEPREEILLNSPLLAHVMRALDFRLLDADRDPIGDAYEVFAGSESRARSGQFFTPRNAMDLLVRAVDPRPGESVIDPACGAGGFLASVARHLRRKGCTPAEVSRAARKFHGIEKDAYLANLARLHASLLTGGHVRVECGDSLGLLTESGSSLEDIMPLSGHDVLLTNPPFGVNIVAAGPGVLQTFQLARKWVFNKSAQRWEPGPETRAQVPPQVLFVERCLSLVREGGRIGMVLPESVLSNKSYRYVVEYVRSHATVEAVIGMPEELFKTSGKGGTHTKVCLLVLTRGTARKKAASIFMAEARWCGQDSRARDIPHDDLPRIGERLEHFKNRELGEESQLGFQLDARAVTGNVLCPRYYDPEVAVELERLSDSHTLLRFGELVAEGWLSIDTGDEVGKLAYGADGGVPFVRTSDLSNWEIKADPKHSIDRDLYFTLARKQDVQPNDILMVKDGTYLIGTCAIVTEYDREIVYQSHLYKIRVRENPHGLNAFLLLALLSSSVVQRQIRAKQFTQDIIDSLGERINELLLPVPKSREHRECITRIVQKVVADRIEARELARKARIDVLAAEFIGTNHCEEMSR
jgi:type I restriction enzyme M protein